MNKYKLQELFDEVDNLKETLENNKKQLYKLLSHFNKILIKINIKVNIYISNIIIFLL